MKNSPEKENGKPMKNDHHKQLKKIEMMMKNLAREDTRLPFLLKELL